MILQIGDFVVDALQRLGWLLHQTVVCFARLFGDYALELGEILCEWDRKYMEETQERHTGNGDSFLVFVFRNGIVWMMFFDHIGMMA